MASSHAPPRQVGSCGISHPYFAHQTAKPIREILVALGGPGGATVHQLGSGGCWDDG